MAARDASTIVNAINTDAPSAEPDAFISYSRKDADFVRRLHAKLRERGKDVWIDWEDIPPTAPWRDEIEDAVAKATTFVFAISPDSRDSEVCLHELELAVGFHKRLIPIVRRPVEPASLPASLNEPNWISFVDDALFDQSLETLLAAFAADLEWMRVHTRLLVNARRWSERNDRSLLLRGSELHEAERALAEHADSDPRPTPLQAEYVHASRRATARRQRITLGAVVGALAVSIALGLVALAQRNVARDQRDRADAQARLATSRQLATQAVANVAKKFDLSLLLAKAAPVIRATPESQAGLFRTVSWTPEIRGFLRAGAVVNDVAFDAGAESLAAGTDDGSVVLWKTASLHHEATLGGRVAVTRVRFGPHPGVLAVGRRDGTVEIWDVTSRRRLRRLVGSLREIVSLAFDGRGRHVAAGDAGGRIAIWGPRSSTPTLSRHFSRLPVLGLAFAHRGKLFVAGDALDTDAQYETVTGRRLPGRPRHVALANRPASQAYSADGRRVAVAGDSGYILVEEAVSGGKPKPILGPQVFVEAMAFAGNRLVSVGQGTLTLWDITAQPRRVLGPLRGFSGRSPRVALANDAHTAAVANESSVIVWNFTARHRLCGTVMGAGFPPPACCEVAVAALSPGGRRVAWYYPPTDVRPPRLLTVGAVEGGKSARKTASVALLNLSQLVYSADGRTLVTIEPLDPSRTKIVVRDATTLRPRRVVRVALSVGAAAFIRRSSSLVAVGPAGSSVVVDTVSGRVRRFLSGPNRRPAAVAISADGTRIAEARADGTVLLWDAAGKPLGSIRTGSEPAAAAFSAGGKLLAIAATDGSTTVWDPDGRLLLRTLQLGELAVLRFSRDGHTLAAVTEHGTISLWDVSSGSLIGSLPADPAGYPVDIAFGRSGKRLFSAGANGVAYIWNLDERAWGRIACAVAGRTLSPAERDQFLGKYATSIRVC